MSNDIDPNAPRRNFYGRRHGKTLKQKQRDAMAELAHLNLSDVSYEANPDRTPLDLSWVNGRQLWLEIGFGGGEHLVHQAVTYPDVAFIGCEPFVNGVAKLMTKIRKAGVTNIRIYPSDVRDLFEVLPDASIDKCFLLYPDPWPKARHNRRRAVNPEYLEPIARVVKSGSEFRVATDIPDYVRQTLEEVPKVGFEWQADCAADWRNPWGDWISTRYEQKAFREGRVPHYLTFRR